MEIIHVVGLVTLGLFILMLAGTFWASGRAKTSHGSADALMGGLTASAVLLIVLLVVGWMGISPEYRLWRASIEKRIAVEEAKAAADSAVELARAEVERAKGTAEANLIVAESITEPYLRYLYIVQLSDTQNQIIYLPTEAGLPILEANRFRNATPDE